MYIIIMIGIVLCSLGCSRLEHRWTTRRDAELAELYGQRLETMLDDAPIGDEVLTRVLDRLSAFAREVEEEFEALDA
jgi:hypothetical protein